ncbi:hypothetical protein KSP40_PGU018937 [Platanthera guangdongensis]|uniref:Uncharacterized protein n=1 Tax=Platanthera guangdongensis TaxID=2320717 RepID=A0ABR2LTV0_9ASPA
MEVRSTISLNSSLVEDVHEKWKQCHARGSPTPTATIPIEQAEGNQTLVEQTGELLIAPTSQREQEARFPVVIDCFPTSCLRESEAEHGIFTARRRLQPSLRRSRLQELQSESRREGAVDWWSMSTNSFNVQLLITGLQPQGQQVENAHTQALTASNHGVTQDSSAGASSVTAAPLTAVVSISNATATPSMSAPTSVPAATSVADAVVQAQNQPVAGSYQQAAGMQAPMAEQWYRQQLQYQQYYQQYPGYDPYQQQYQQYGQYQQQPYQQYPQNQMQLQTQVLGHSQFPQAQHVPVQQSHPQVQPQIIQQTTQLSAQPGPPHYPQVQAYPQVQQPVVQPAVLPQQLPQPPMQQHHPQSQQRPVSVPQAAYVQSQSLQQIPHGVQQQRPTHPQLPGVAQQASQSQFPIQQPQQMRPPQTHISVQAQQYPAMQPHAQAPFTNAASHPQVNHSANQPGQQIHLPVGVQIHPQQQSIGQFPSTQLPQQGGFPSQPPSHSQHSSRPQGQPYVQSQLSVPPTQGRNVVPNQPMPQQVQHSPAKPIQSGLNQHSPNHNHLARQHGSTQQSHLHSGSQGSLVSTASRSGTDTYQLTATGSDPKSAVVEKTADSVINKVNQVKQSAKEAAGNADGSETSRSSELVISKPEGDSKSLGEGEASITDIKENVETTEKKDGLMSILNGDEQEESNISKFVESEKEIHRTEGKPNIKPSPMVEGMTTESISDGPNTVQSLPGKNKEMDNGDQVYSTRSQGIGNAVLPNLQGQLQHGAESHDKVLPLPGYHDRGPSQFPQPQSGSVGLRRISPSGPPLHHEIHAPQSFPHGHTPVMSDGSMVSQRPSGPDRIFPQIMPQSGLSQERRFKEPFPYAIPGPPTAHGQLRPPGYVENSPYLAQAPVMAEPFQTPAIKQPYGSTISPKNVEEINPFPLRSQSYGAPSIPVSQVSGHMDPLTRPVMGGPGYYDGRQFDSHRSLPGEHTPFGQQTAMQPNMMKMNGLSGKGPAAVMNDLAFSHGVSDDRFRPPPGERFRPLPEEGFRAQQCEQFGPTMESGRHIANHREFNDGLKLFPRPGHLDGDGAQSFNSYGASSRSLDRDSDGGLRPFDRASVGSFPPHPLTGRVPPSSGTTEFVPLEIADRQRGPPFHEDLGGKHDAHPERFRPFPEYSRPHFDRLPHIRSPGIPDVSGNFRAEPAHFRKEIDGFDISQNRLRASDHVGHGLTNNVRAGEQFGSRNLPSHSRFNDPASHGLVRGGEPFGFGGYGRTPIGDSGFSNSYPLHGSASLHGDVESLEHLRKRNVSSGWCRICKIDCETVEGLEVHSQTKDHQNMAMEIVLGIKKENAKKQKLSVF